MSNRGASLDRPVNNRGPVNGENGEFGGFREANERNHDGSARGPVGGISNWRTAQKRKYWRMFGMRAGGQTPMTSTKPGGGKLWFWGVAPHRGRVSNFGDVPTAWGQVGFLADAGSQTTMTRMWEAVSDPRAKGGSAEDSRRRFSCEARSLPPERTGRQTHFPGLSAADACGLLCPGHGQGTQSFWHLDQVADGTVCVCGSQS